MNINDLKRKAECIFSQYHVQPIIKEEDETSIYNIERDKAELEIIIGPRWIGYELSVSDSFFGHKIGNSLDTDNYPLDYNESISREIFEETTECLKGFLEGGIYVGMYNAYPALAIPISRTTYKVKLFKFRTHWWQIFESSETEVVAAKKIKALLNAKPIT